MTSHDDTARTLAVDILSRVLTAVWFAQAGEANPLPEDMHEQLLIEIAAVLQLSYERGLKVL